MNNERVLLLDHVRAGHAGVAGGKGSNLGELASAGLPVPPAFIISAAAFREFFAAIGVNEEDATCDEIRQSILGAELNGELASEILDAHARLTSGDSGIVCAVRSSATAEDLAGASFAGQHGTYYYVDRSMLLEMVRHCWASLWSRQAASYRTTHGVAHDGVAMAVVVQRMVRSEVSGVAFTANPISGDYSEIVIESSWGMGAALVDGRVTPDRYVVAREGLRLRERRIADKRFMVPPERDGDGSERMVEVPHDLRRLETLTSDQVQAVAALALRCESHFGAPQDVEWAMEGGRLHLLQSRPITTLGKQPAASRPPGKWVLFKAVAENFTDPLTPLTIDLMQPFPQGLVRAIEGRLYMNVSVARLFLPLHLSDEALANLVYLSGEGVPERFRVAWHRLPAAILGGLLGWLVFAMLLARSRDMPDDFMDQYRAHCREIGSDPRLGPMGAMRRLLVSPWLLDPVGLMVIPVNGSAAFRGPLWVGVTRSMLRRWAPDARPDAVALLCSGSEGVLSAEMGRGIAALAEAARAEPAVAEILVRSSTDKALERLRQEPAAAGFLHSLHGYLAVHGHRAAKEFELQTPRWEENPAPVLGMIRNHLVETTLAPFTPRAADGGRAELEAGLRRRLGWRWRLVSLAAKRARYFLKLRENSRFFHIMGFGVIRKKILAIEAALLGEGKLRCRDDIFFLHLDEVAALGNASLRWSDVEDRIRERRIEHVRLSKITPPRTIGIATAERPDESTGDLLHGQCASPGKHVGTARVILDPSIDATLSRGEVLVAPYTDPAWTPLFLTAGAAVVEVGSYLSHAGTVAREYRMPCVVDVTGCTRRIQSGMRVEVDGDQGTVRVLGAEQT